MGDRESDSEPLLSNQESTRTDDAQCMLSQRNVWLNGVQKRLQDPFKWQLFLLYFLAIDNLPFNFLDSLRNESDPTKLFSKLTTSDDESCCSPYTHDEVMKMFVQCLRNLGKTGQEAVDDINFPMPPEDAIELRQSPISELMEVIVRTLLHIQPYKRLRFLAFLNAKYLGGVPAESELDKCVFSTFSQLHQKRALWPNTENECLVQAFQHAHATEDDLLHFNEFNRKHHLKAIEALDRSIPEVVYPDSASRSVPAVGVQRTISGSSAEGSYFRVGQHGQVGVGDCTTSCCVRYKCRWISVLAIAIAVLLAAIWFIPGRLAQNSYSKSVYGVSNTTTGVILANDINTFWYSSVDIQQTPAIDVHSMNSPDYLPSIAYFVPLNEVKVYDSLPDTHKISKFTDHPIVDEIKLQFYLIVGASFNYSLCLDPLNLTLYSASLLLFNDDSTYENYLGRDENTNYTCREPECLKWLFPINMTEPSCHSLPGPYIARKDSYYFLTTTIKGNSKGIRFNATVIEQAKYLNESDYSKSDYSSCNIKEPCTQQLNSRLPTLSNTKSYQILAFIGVADGSDRNVYFIVSVKRSLYVLVYAAIIAIGCVIALHWHYIFYMWMHAVQVSKQANKCMKLLSFFTLPFVYNVMYSNCCDVCSSVPCVTYPV